MWWGEQGPRILFPQDLPCHYLRRPQQPLLQASSEPPGLVATHNSQASDRPFTFSPSPNTEVCFEVETVSRLY